MMIRCYFPIVVWFSMCFVEIHSMVSLRGAGASFPYEVFKRWIASYKTYRADFVDLDMSYQAVGSGTGKSWFKEKTIPLEYAGSDSVLSDQDYVDDPDLQMFPTMAGAIVLGYNLQGIASLNLSREVLVGIYNGTYSTWNDPDIVAINPSIILPHQNILRIARGDESGSTEIFTKALSKFSETWSEQYGSFSLGLDETYRPHHWDNNVIDYYVRKSKGVSSLISSTNGTIGYLSLAEAKQAHIKYANVINRAGYAIEPSAFTIRSAAGEFGYEFEDTLTLDIIDGEGENSYPLSSYTYFIIHKTTMLNCASVSELWRYIDWFLHDHDARNTCLTFEHSPLDDLVVQQVKSRILDVLKCGGDMVSVNVERQLNDEVRSTPSHDEIIAIAVPVVLTVLLLPLLVYLTLQKFKIHRAILRGEWKISTERLEICPRNNMGKSLSTSFSMRSLYSKGVSTHILGNSWSDSIDQVGMMDKEQFVLFGEMNLDYDVSLKFKAKQGILSVRDKISHVNITKWYGLCYMHDVVYSVSELCAKGRLNDILQNETHILDEQFKYSISCDIARGMCYLHKAGIVHGRLSSEACVLDHRWNVKVGDWYLNHIAQLQGDANILQQPKNDIWGLEQDENVTARTKFWTPPEVLDDPDLEPTKEGDMYSFAILLVEIFTRNDPYSEECEGLTPVEIINSVKNDNMRPKLPQDFPITLLPLLHEAWARSPIKRPKFTETKRILDRCKPSKKSVLDCMMEAMENYTQLLEEKVAERTYELEVAVQKTTDLLHKMLPPAVAKKLSEGYAVDPELYQSVTIFFSDIVGFTSLASDSTAMEIVAMLNDLYTTFDEVVDQHDVYKVETIGDAYMVISGAPERNGNQHAAHVASMALGLASASESFLIQHRPNTTLEYRAGIHSGSVCTGVVGIKMPRYCIFGDTVNTASRMESTSESRKIQVSQSSMELLCQTSGFILEPRGSIMIKGKGEMNTFWLTGRDTQTQRVTLPVIDH